MGAQWRPNCRHLKSLNALHHDMYHSEETRSNAIYWVVAFTLGASLGLRASGS